MPGHYLLARNRADKKALINHYRDWLILLSLGVLSILIILDLFNTSGFIHSLYQGTYQYRDFTLYERLLTQPRVIFFHLSQFFWPVPARFSIEHSVVISQSILSPMTTLYSILALLAWIALGIALMLTQHFRLWGYFILWIPSTLAIESSFVPLEMVFEHRMYLPLFGLIGLIAMVFRWMLGMQSAHQWATKFLYLGLCFFIFVSCWATRQRLPDWRTKITLLESAVDNAANSDRLWGNLSTYYYKDGQINKSIQAAQKTLRLNPDNSDALETMGVIYMDRNQLVRAEEKLRSALMQKPHSSGFNHWGELKLKQGQPEEAMISFLKAIELSPWIANYHWNVALTYEQLNRCRHSRQHWLEYIRLADGDLVGIQDVNQHLKEEYNQPNGKCFSK